MLQHSRRIAVLIGALAALVVHAASAIAAAQADTEVVTLDRDLVRLNTSNPPGNEGRVADYMRDRLAPLGFEVDDHPDADAGKAHLIARLRSANPAASRSCCPPTPTRSAWSRSCGASTRSPA